MIDVNKAVPSTTRYRNIVVQKNNNTKTNRLTDGRYNRIYKKGNVISTEDKILIEIVFFETVKLSSFGKK